MVGLGKGFSLDGATAVILGATGGLGRELALEFASRGATIIANARNRPNLEALKDEITDTYKTRAKIIEGDAVRLSTARQISDQIRVSALLGRPIIVVPAIGGHELEYLTPEQLDTFDSPPSYDEIKRLLSRIDENGNTGTHNETAYTVLENQHIIRPLDFDRMLLESDAKTSFLYISSKASEKEWWELGNAYYGILKSIAERQLKLHHLQDPPDSIHSYQILRYPFFRSKMGEKVYNALCRWDEGLKSAGWENVAVPADQVARATADLVERGQSDSFEKKEGEHIWTYVGTPD